MFSNQVQTDHGPASHVPSGYQLRQASPGMDEQTLRQPASFSGGHGDVLAILTVDQNGAITEIIFDRWALFRDLPVTATLFQFIPRTSHIRVRQGLRDVFEIKKTFRITTDSIGGKGGASYCFQINPIASEQSPDRAIVALSEAEDDHQDKRSHRSEQHLSDQLNKTRKKLDETRIALKVVLDELEQQRQQLQENVFLNLQQIMAPKLRQLKASKLAPKQKNLINTIESNLNRIASSFVPQSLLKNYNLTPMELQVAELIREGRTNKEIADLLNLSTNTILTHRHHVRAKLGLKNKKTNLRSFLIAMETPSHERTREAKDDDLLTNPSPA